MTEAYCHGCMATAEVGARSLCPDCDRIFFPEDHDLGEPSDALRNQRDRMRITPDLETQLTQTEGIPTALVELAHREGLRILSNPLDAPVEQINNLVMETLQELKHVVEHVKRYEQHYVEVRQQDGSCKPKV